MLIPMKELKLHKSREKTVPMKCEVCKKIFYTSKHEVQTALSSTRGNLLRFCSLACNGKSTCKKIKIKCCQCGKTVIKKQYDVARMKHSFCSKSCSATFGNLNKNFGLSKRSKLEIWLETKLSEKYPFVKFLFTDRKTLNGLELDIHLPALRLAFELNGIFHYEPVFGRKYLSSIRKRDKEKLEWCSKKGILLYQIDTRKMKAFKENIAAEFLENIIKIITIKLAEDRTFEVQSGLTPIPQISNLV